MSKTIADLDAMMMYPTKPTMHKLVDLEEMIEEGQEKIRHAMIVVTHPNRDDNEENLRDEDAISIYPSEREYITLKQMLDELRELEKEELNKQYGKSVEIR